MKLEATGQIVSRRNPDGTISTTWEGGGVVEISGEMLHAAKRGDTAPHFVPVGKRTYWMAQIGTLRLICLKVTEGSYYDSYLFMRDGLKARAFAAYYNYVPRLAFAVCSLEGRVRRFFGQETEGRIMPAPRAIFSRLL